MIIKHLKKGMKDFGDSITALVNLILLSVVYVVGVGITSIVSKIVNKKFIDEKLYKKKSYWTDLKLKKLDIEEY